MSGRRIWINITTATLKGKAIYLAIIISFIAAIFAFLFILSRYYERVSLTQLQMELKLNDHTLSALNVLMQQPFSNSPEYTSMALFGDSLISLKVKSYPWGMYGIASARASWKTMQQTRTALYGTEFNTDDPTGLWLTDHGHYLAVAGDAFLSGTCYLPKLGARKAYIDGQPFKYNKTIEGSISTSKDKLPGFSHEIMEYIKTDIFLGNAGTDSLIDDYILHEKYFSREFEKIPVRIYSDKDMILHGGEFQGAIIFQSEKSIFLSEDVKLQHVICVAPNIWVSPGFEGTVQLIAGDTLVIGEDARLLYPSAAVAAGFGRSGTFLQLQKGAVVEGTLLNFAELLEGTEAFTDLEENTEVYGTLYSSGKTQHKGKVFGTLYTDKLTLKTRQGLYENHLFNAWVDPATLPDGFVQGLFLNNPETLNNILQWVN